LVRIYLSFRRDYEDEHGVATPEPPEPPPPAPEPPQHAATA
jgi:hypothetical protein